MSIGLFQLSIWKLSVTLLLAPFLTPNMQSFCDFTCSPSGIRPIGGTKLPTFSLLLGLLILTPVPYAGSTKNADRIKPLW